MKVHPGVDAFLAARPELRAPLASDLDDADRIYRRLLDTGTLTGHETADSTEIKELRTDV